MSTQELDSKVSALRELQSTIEQMQAEAEAINPYHSARPDRPNAQPEGQSHYKPRPPAQSRKEHLK